MVVRYGIIIERSKHAGVAQLVEQLICNQQVAGSSPITSSRHLEGFPSGQRGQTVNLLSVTSVVRIHPPPPVKKPLSCDKGFLTEKDGYPLGRTQRANI